MCGIAGFLTLDGSNASATIVKHMTDAIAHRGPDGSGVFAENAIALGNRRLAIIDLSSAADQPMMSADGRHVITYNGELYNYQTLKRELQALGRQFRTNSDTEVVLEAFSYWGTEALLRFNGMFAFAIWDRSSKKLLLARDRFGVKPLYYGQQGSQFIFASEIKSFLKHPQWKTTLNLPGLLEYFTFQNFCTDSTLFEGIKLLPPGCAVTRNAQGALSRTQYWDFDFHQDDSAKGSRTDYEEELDRLFRQAVSRQLTSDVEVGAYLSGGMDSGSITTLASREISNLKSFTAGFESHSALGLEVGFSDERAAAEHLSYLLQTEHYEIVLKAGDMVRVMPDLIWHLDEPRVGQSYPNYYAAKLASKFTKVVLSGSGGDELFGGYPWRYYRAVVNDSFEHYIDKYYLFWQRLVPNRTIREVFRPVWNNVSHVWTRDLFANVFRDHARELTRPEDYINHSLYFEAKTFLQGILMVEDKLSMAHSLETRVPFLDNDLVDFAMRLPVRYKLGNLAEIVRLDENEPGPKTEKFFQRTRDGKLLLRKCMARYIPQEVTQRHKQGFSGPDSSWFRGSSIDYVRSTLYNKTARIYDFFDYHAVTTLVEDHLSGRVNRRLLIWSLLSFEQWCSTFL